MPSNESSATNFDAAEATAASGALAPRRVLSEAELAHRWGVSQKTLQRWRTEGLGPRFLKLSKHVKYPLEAVTDFETRSLRASTSQRVYRSDE